METTDTAITGHQIVSRQEWTAARKGLLRKEKELTQLRDQLSAERRKLPWVQVEKNYVFDGPNGKETLAELFGGRSQLVVKHFMFGPEWQEGCVGCSFEVDHIEGALVNLEHHDVTYVAVSRAPLEKIEEFKQRMGWRFKWVSSYGSDFSTSITTSLSQKRNLLRARWTTITERRIPRSTSSPASACFTRMRPATSSTPIRPTRAGLKSC